jgi:hypothetical protein
MGVANGGRLTEEWVVGQDKRCENTGSFFLDSANELYDDLARRAALPDADPLLRRRWASSAVRMIELIACHGDRSWHGRAAGYLADLRRIERLQPSDPSVSSAAERGALIASKLK